MRYTPQPQYAGRDSFDYTIPDGQGGTASATVSISVNQANRPPTARDDHIATPQNTPVTIAVLANDNIRMDIVLLSGFQNPSDQGAPSLGMSAAHPAIPMMIGGSKLPSPASQVMIRSPMKSAMEN